MVVEGLEWHASGPPVLPIAGDLLASEVGLEPGPELGRLIERLEAAVWSGEIESASDAVALARALLEEE
jgi:hypothetical protein